MPFPYIAPPRGQVAQLVEQRTENPRVGGSIPSLAILLIQPFALNTNGLGECQLVGLFWFQLVRFGPLCACWDNIRITGSMAQAIDSRPSCGPLAVRVRIAYPDI
jgi:hypothetical protein